MTEETTPIPDDFEEGLNEEVEQWLSSQPATPTPAVWRALHVLIHPVAEAFAEQFLEEAGSDPRKVLPPPCTQFVHCVSQILLSSFLDVDELADLPDRFAAVMAWAVFAGWKAHESVSTGSLRIPDLKP
jgi:hypothetical protein